MSTLSRTALLLFTLGLAITAIIITAFAVAERRRDRRNSKSFQLGGRYTPDPFGHGGTHQRQEYSPDSYAVGRGVEGDTIRHSTQIASLGHLVSQNPLEDGFYRDGDCLGFRVGLRTIAATTLLPVLAYSSIFILLVMAGLSFAQGFYRAVPATTVFFMLYDVIAVTAGAFLCESMGKFDLRKKCLRAGGSRGMNIPFSRIESMTVFTDEKTEKRRRGRNAPGIRLILKTRTESATVVYVRCWNAENFDGYADVVRRILGRDLAVKYVTGKSATAPHKN